MPRWKLIYGGKTVFSPICLMAPEDCNSIFVGRWAASWQSQLQLKVNQKYNEATNSQNLPPYNRLSSAWLHHPIPSTKSASPSGEQAVNYLCVRETLLIQISTLSSSLWILVLPFNIVIHSLFFCQKSHCSLCALLLITWDLHICMYNAYLMCYVDWVNKVTLTW